MVSSGEAFCVAICEPGMVVSAGAEATPHQSLASVVEHLMLAEVQSCEVVVCREHARKVQRALLLDAAQEGVLDVQAEQSPVSLVESGCYCH
eukprot:122928-Prorocentrum_minimum.AAC.2